MPGQSHTVIHQPLARKRSRLGAAGRAPLSTPTPEKEN